jgi:hypothetical protein
VDKLVENLAPPGLSSWPDSTPTPADQNMGKIVNQLINIDNFNVKCKSAVTNYNRPWALGQRTFVRPSCEQLLACTPRNPMRRHKSAAAEGVTAEG